MQDSGQRMEDGRHTGFTRKKVDHAAACKFFFFKFRMAPCTFLDKSQYPLARSACSFVIKTCQNQEFVLEAHSEIQRDLICERWKLVVARFASLAVTEDSDTIVQ